ncbi:MAG: ABC transporter permease [Anaerolineae bacterium]|nr:ABC transporter permease [Anaerolineae bacterium]
MTPTTSRSTNAQRAPLAILAILLGALVSLFITIQVFGGSLDGLGESINTTPGAPGILLVNVMVGVSIALFVWQLRWNALRVTLTVVFALILGYIVTSLFNLDSANRFTRGEFKTVVISSAVSPETTETVDLKYGQVRGGEFNKEKVAKPLTEAKYTFMGTKGDKVDILAFAASRRSLVDVQVALLDADGKELASATGSTADQIETHKDQLRTEKDAIIPDFTLPADGIYTVYVKPETPSLSLVYSETTQATNNAYNAFLLGALGRPNRWAVWIQDAITLILVGLAIAIVFRARQFALGAEGQIYLGALLSGSIALATGTNLPALILIPICIVAAMIAGFLWGLIPGALKAYLGANELVSSLMLNTIAIRFFELILTFQLKPPEAGYIASSTLPSNALLPVIVQDTQVTWAIFIVIIAVIAVWVLIERTPLGYEIRMVGSNQKFAAYGGINTKRTIMLAMGVSGALAGLAGAHLSMGIFRQLLINMSVNLAFEGVVVALLARNNPLVIPFTGLLYAYLRAGAQFMERDANVSFEVVRIIQAVIILLITAEALATFFQSRRLANKVNPTPQADAQTNPATA